MKGIKWAGLCLLAATGTSLGAGFQLYTEGSAEALGQAGAISGRTNLISQAWYNPAALGGADHAAVMAGASFVQLQTDFKSDLSPSLNASMDNEWRSIPHFYYVQPLSENLTGMLSINAPYGLITEWASGWAGSPAAVFSELATVYTTPTLAYRFTENLSIAAGLNVVYGEARLTANRGGLGEREIEGDDYGWGYTFSGHYELAEDWGIGLRYQSNVELEPQGEIKFDNDPLGVGDTFHTRGYVEIPASVNMGVANHSFENLTLGFDVVWTEWSSYDELRFDFEDAYVFPALLPGFSNPEQNEKNWKDVWSVRLGGEYALSDHWALRCGYVWDESPVANKTLAPELPGSDRQMVMWGLGWQGEHLGIDFAYSFLWADKAVTGDDIVATIASSAGEYETTTHLLALSGSYTF